ncbi:grifin [Electrophorus electricus]|uniref:grifin n=1 Tax=Electrophorus electricus TaxID=8005 RepID=UPI0015CFF845|nr:grifin [Electrophorus electricus]
MRFPNLQFEVSCPGELCPGSSIILKRKTFSKSSRFEINFLCDRDDRIAFRFKLHFTKSDIICNSFTGNCWGQEKSSSNFHFSTDEPFQVEIYSNNDYFHIYFADTFLLEHVTSLQSPLERSAEAGESYGTPAGDRDWYNVYQSSELDYVDSYCPAERPSLILASL